jgi:hypothetical protein
LPKRLVFYLSAQTKGTKMISPTGSQINNLQTIDTEIGEFGVEQRNAGFADNDGKWIVTQCGELYWSFGEMRRRARGKVLGIFATIADAEIAIRDAQPLPADDHAVGA